jgi:hypothetical protein
MRTRIHKHNPKPINIYLYQCVLSPLGWNPGARLHKMKDLVRIFGNRCSLHEVRNVAFGVSGYPATSFINQNLPKYILLKLWSAEKQRIGF